MHTLSWLDFNLTASNSASTPSNKRLMMMMMMITNSNLTVELSCCISRMSCGRINVNKSKLWRYWGAESLSQRSFRREIWDLMKRETDIISFCVFSIHIDQKLSVSNFKRFWCPAETVFMSWKVDLFDYYKQRNSLKTWLFVILLCKMPLSNFQLSRSPTSQCGATCSLYLDYAVLLTPLMSRKLIVNDLALNLVFVD